MIFSLNKPNNVIKMAALALYCITANHPFMDGCKRTGFEIADLLIREKGLHIHGAENEIRDALLKIAKYECTVGKIELWLKRNIRPLKTS
ncbi:MAG: type II toxin-antitoxin system death-on-curing family toxin [Methanosarcinales archaeon]